MSSTNTATIQNRRNSNKDSQVSTSETVADQMNQNQLLYESLKSLFDVIVAYRRHIMQQKNYK